MVPRSLLWLLSVVGILLPGRLATSVEYDAKIPQLAFAAQELQRAITEAERVDLKVTLAIHPDQASPEAFHIRSVGSDRIEVVGSD